MQTRSETRKKDFLSAQQVLDRMKLTATEKKGLMSRIWEKIKKTPGRIGTILKDTLSNPAVIGTATAIGLGFAGKKLHERGYLDKIPSMLNNAANYTIDKVQSFKKPKKKTQVAIEEEEKYNEGSFLHKKDNTF